MLWKTPIYKFRIPVSEDSDKLKEIVIDVTGSAPVFYEPSPGLKEVLKEIFKSTELEKIETVLEFGAAKLKNIPFILNEGKTVCAVEFEKLTVNNMTKNNLTKCRKHGSKFQELIFPSPFLTDTKTFDLALLINVPPVMPVFAERLYLLDLLYQKVKDKRYLLWVAQKEGPYKKIRESGKFACGDGVWRGEGRHHKTFYRYHCVEELDELMSLYGFKLIKRFSIGDDARLYQKTEHNLFSGLITPDRIEQNIHVDDSIKPDKNARRLKTVKMSEKIKPIVPNPKALSIEKLYKELLESIPKGQDPELYHRVVSHAIARIFRGSLRDIDIKVGINNNIKIIDTVFTNCAKEGFFDNLKSKVDCSHPIIEVKNISGDPTNDDIDQLNGRLNPTRGKFGMLLCRDIEDEKRVYERCKTYLNEHYILVLSEKDILEMLEYSREKDQDAINALMDKKLKKLLF